MWSVGLVGWWVACLEKKETEEKKKKKKNQVMSMKARDLTAGTQQQQKFLFYTSIFPNSLIVYAVVFI